jgi:hypothetical protein
MARRPPPNRRHRYDLSPAVPDRPESRTVYQAAMAATTWAEWEAAQAQVSMYGARITPVPWALNWQRNPDAPLPPGHVWLRCLCLAWVGRPSSWRGEMGAEGFGRSYRRVVKPATSAGDICERCRVPIVQVAGRDVDYPRVVVIAPEGDRLPAGAAEAVLDWCRGQGLPVD